MSSTLIIYSTTDGQTKAVCNKIGSIIELTRSTEIVSIDDVNNLNISNYDQIVIGASIRYGKHNPKLFQFIENNISISGTPAIKLNNYLKQAIILNKMVKNK